MLRVDIAHEREGKSAGGVAREESGGGGMPGAPRVVGRLECRTMAQERGLVNIAMLLPAPHRARPRRPVSILAAVAAATVVEVVFCHSIVAGRLVDDNLELGERPERRVSERTEGVEPR